MRGKSLIMLIAIPLLLLAGDVVYWRIATERLRSGYEAWRAARLAEGWDVESGPPSAGGWPQAATIDLPNLTLRHQAPAVAGNIEASATAVALSVSLLRPDTLTIELRGPAHLRQPGGPEIVLAGEQVVATVPLQPAGSQLLDLQAKNLLVEPATGAWRATVGLLTARASVPETPALDQSGVGQPSPAVSFGISAEAISLPAMVKWPLGTNISSLSLDGLLNGPFPKVRDTTRWAEAWRDGGGSLAITHLTVGWGPLGLTSSATLALDEQLQPMGSGNGRIVGYAETLDRLSAAGMLTKSAATAAKAVLSLLAGTTDADEPSAVDVPLTLQYRTLSMRQVPLIRLPELDWPAR